MSSLSFPQDTAAELCATSSAALRFASFCRHHCRTAWCWRRKQQRNYAKTDLTGTCWPTQNYKRMPLSGSCTTLNFYSHVTKMPWDCMAFEPWHLHTKQPFCQPLEQIVLQTLLLHSCHREFGVFPSQIWSSSQNHKRESGGDEHAQK